MFNKHIHVSDLLQKHQRFLEPEQLYQKAYNILLLLCMNMLATASSNGDMNKYSINTMYEYAGNYLSQWR